MATTKKIPELPVYGSVTEVMADDDLFEISKNSGTPGSPIYASGSSRRITRKQLVDFLGGIPYSGARHEVVKETGNAIQNGVNFMSAYASAAGKANPGDRAIVAILAGKIDIPSSLTLSANVTIVGIGDPKDTIFDSSAGLSSVFSVSDSASDYSLINLTVRNTGNPSGLSIGHGSGVIDNGAWDNIILDAPTDECVWNGTYNKVNGLVDYVLVGSIGASGKISNSNFKNKSCGYSETASTDIIGKIFNCTGIDYCFGFSSAGYAAISGNIDNTTGRDYCFGSTTFDNNGVDITGTIFNCTGRNYCFSATNSNLALIALTGLVTNCKATSFSFAYSPVGANQAMSGSIYNCKYGAANGLVHSSPNGHKWREYLGNDGLWQMEDLGI